MKIKRSDTVMSRAAAICLAVCISVGLGAQASPAPSPSATKVEKTFGAWTVTCLENSGTKRCSLYERLGAAKTKKVVFAWTVATTPTKEMTNSLVVVGGVSIKEGIRVSIGNGAPRTVPYDVCGGGACQASFPLDAATLQAMSSSPQANVNFVQASRKLVQLQIDLKDFPKAYEYFKSQL